MDSGSQAPYRHRSDGKDALDSMETTVAGACLTQGAISIVFAALLACGIAPAEAQPMSARNDPSPSAVEPGQTAAEQLRALLDEDLAAVFRRSPLFATVRGVPGYNHLLPDLSPATHERARADERRMLARLQAIDAGALRGQDRVSLELLLDKLRSAVGKQRFVNSDALVLSTLGGIQNMMPRAAQITPFRTVDDYRDYIKRLSSIPRLADQTIEQLGAGIRSGWMRPAPVADRVVAAIDAHLVENVDESVLMDPFKRFANGVPENERAALVTAVRRAIAEDYQPALRRLQTFIAREYRPKAPADAGLAALPGGAEYYEFLIGAGVVRGMTAAQIHALGLREVERLHNEIGQIPRRTGFAGTTGEFIRHLRTDPQFFFTSPEAVLTAYRAMAQRVDPQLSRLFHAMPRMPYAVRSMTASEAASSTAANYTGGSLALGTSGFFTINALGFANEATWRVETLFLHEAVPGHHLQIARAAEIDSLHLWRRMAGGNVAYSEGWALYAETLGFDLGLFKDPYQHYGHLQAELFRAARLVVDTGIHAYNWPRARAVEYMATQGGVDHAFAVSEVDRYFSNPTQALGYMLGQRKFLELRARAERALGRGFDVRDFHAAVLDNGPVTLAVLEKLVDEWIAGRGIPSGLRAPIEEATTYPRQRAGVRRRQRPP